jgi:cytochrome c peroxidase
MKRGFFLAAMMIAAVLPAMADTPWAWRLPRGETPPPIPSDNPLTQEKAELGRRLFYDSRLSGPGTMSCANCHQQGRGFADEKIRAVGVTGEQHARNVPPLANVGYYPVLTWSDSTIRRPEEQLFTPLFGEHPVEMGGAGREEEILGRLKDDAAYRSLFAAAFPSVSDPITWPNVGRAIASFERVLVSFDSAYDRDRRGELPLSAEEKRGRSIFFGTTGQCATCHAGKLFSDFRYHAPEGGGLGAARVRTPSLRNIGQTAPYFSNGSAPDLETVVATHQRGARLNDEDRQALVAFLRSLTDFSFLADPRYGDPQD